MADQRGNRRSLRHAWRQDMRLTRSDGSVLHAVGESMLRGALAVRLAGTVFTGERLRLDALLADHTDHHLEPLTMTVQVSYVVALTHPPDMLRVGLVIDQIDAANRDRLLAFIRRQLRRERGATHGNTADQTDSTADSA